MSINSTITPQKVGARLTETEFDLMAEGIGNLRDSKLNPDFNAVLTKYGLSKADDDILVRFMREATDEFESPST